MTVFFFQGEQKIEILENARISCNSDPYLRLNFFVPPSRPPDGFSAIKFEITVPAPMIFKLCFCLKLRNLIYRLALSWSVSSFYHPLELILFNSLVTKLNGNALLKKYETKFETSTFSTAQFSMGSQKLFVFCNLASIRMPHSFCR